METATKTLRQGSDSDRLKELATAPVWRLLL